GRRASARVGRDTGTAGGCRAGGRPDDGARRCRRCLGGAGAARVPAGAGRVDDPPPARPRPRRRLVVPVAVSPAGLPDGSLVCTRGVCFRAIGGLVWWVG